MPLITDLHLDTEPHLGRQKEGLVNEDPGGERDLNKENTYWKVNWLHCELREEGGRRESVVDINPPKYSSLLAYLVSDGGGKNLFEKKTNCVIVLLQKC